MWRKGVQFVAVVCGMLMLMGCIQEKPLVSTSEGTTDMTLDELRGWVAEQLDAAVGASEAPDGWFDIYWKDVFWAEDRLEDRELLISAWTPNDCGSGSGRLDVSIKNQSFEDPLAAAARVKAFWEAEGLPVRDLYETHNDTEPYFIVDFADGGTFSMQAGTEGMSMSVITACSTDGSVANWMDDLDSENPFRDELERREGAKNTQP